MRKSFRDRNPIAVGLASILVIGTVVGFAFMVGVFHLLEDTYTVHGVFADASGIRGGDDVRVAGVKVGRVERVEADRKAGHVVVQFVVNKGVHLGPDTRAEITIQTLLGSKYLRLTGAVERPYLEDLPSPRRVIPISRTRTPFDVFELTTVATRAIEKADNEKLNTFIRQLADITEGNAEDVQTLVHSLADVSQALGQRDAQLRSLLDRFDQLSALLAEKDQTLVGLIDQSQAVLDMVARRRAEVVAGLRGGQQVTTQLGELLTTHQTELDSILDTLHPVVDILDRRSADLDRALPVVGAGALGLAKPPTHGPWLDIYVRGIGPDLLEVLQDYLGDEEGEAIRR